MTIDEIIDLLDSVAKRGFESPEVKGKYGDYMEQRVTFTDSEKQNVKQFCADNLKILRTIDYPISSLLYDKEERTASLLSMFQYMLTSETNPEYVAANAQRLINARDKFNIISTEDLKSLYDK